MLSLSYYIKSTRNRGEGREKEKEKIFRDSNPGEVISGHTQIILFGRGPQKTHKAHIGE
jgi:hypothetical protein